MVLLSSVCEFNKTIDFLNFLFKSTTFTVLLSSTCKKNQENNTIKQSICTLFDGVIVLNLKNKTFQDNNTVKQSISTLFAGVIIFNLKNKTFQDNNTIKQSISTLFDGVIIFNLWIQQDISRQLTPSIQEYFYLVWRCYCLQSLNSTRQLIFQHFLFKSITTLFDGVIVLNLEKQDISRQ